MSHFLQNFHPIFPLSSGSVLFGKKKNFSTIILSYRLVAAWLTSDVKQTAAAWVSSKNRNRKWPRCHAWGANQVGWCHCCSDTLTARSQGIRKMSLNCHTGAPMSQPRTENLRRRFNKTDKHMTSFKPVRVWVSERKGECVWVSVWEGIWVCVRCGLNDRRSTDCAQVTCVFRVPRMLTHSHDRFCWLGSTWSRSRPDLSEEKERRAQSQSQTRPPRCRAARRHRAELPLLLGCSNRCWESPGSLWTARWRTHWRNAPAARGPPMGWRLTRHCPSSPPPPLSPPQPQSCR